MNLKMWLIYKQDIEFGCIFDIQYFPLHLRVQNQQCRLEKLGFVCNIFKLHFFSFCSQIFLWQYILQWSR